MIAKYSLLLSLILSSFGSFSQDLPNLKRSLQDNPDNLVGLKSACDLAEHYLYKDVDSNSYYINAAKKISEDLGLDTALIMVHITVAKRLKLDAKMDSAISLLELVSEIAVENDWTRVAMISKINIAANYFHLGDYENSIEFYRAGQDLAGEISDSINYSVTLNGEGLCLISLGKYEEAIEVLRSVSPLAKRLDDLEVHARSLYYIAYMYYELDQVQLSKEYYTECLDVCLEIGEDRLAQFSALSIGEIEAGLGNLQQALEAQQKGLRVTRKMGDIKAMAGLYSNIGETYRFLEEFDLALTYADSSLSIARENSLLTEHQASLVGRAETYLSLNQADKALRDLKTREGLFSDSQNTFADGDLLELYAKTYEALGDYKQALVFKNRFVAFKDSSYQADSKAKLLELETKYQLSEKEKALADKDAKIAMQNLELEQAKLIKIVIACIAGFFLLLTFYLIFAYRVKSKARKAQAIINEKLLQSNMKLQELNKEKNNLIAIVAHDLKSPFHNIIGLTNVLAKTTTLAPKQKKIVDMIDKSAGNVSHMIDHILDLNKIESNLLNLELSEVNLSDIAQMLVERFQFTAKDKRIRISSEIDKSVFALANENYFNQVAENILSNAIKFSNKESEIKLKLRIDKEFALLEVIDQGPGISPEFAERIFQPNMVGNAKPTGGEGSTGIGLAIVKRFVDSMGGDVGFNTELGKGTRFYVRLRLAG